MILGRVYTIDLQDNIIVICIYSRAAHMSIWECQRLNRQSAVLSKKRVKHFPNNAGMKNRADRNLGEFVSLFVTYFIDCL